MRIGIVCYPSMGGSGIVATVLGQMLARRGHELHFISYDLPRRLVSNDHPRIQFHHVDVPVYPVFRFPPYTLALATELVRLVETRELELVHVHYAIPHSTSALLAKLMLCQRRQHYLRVVTTLHGTDTELVGQEPSYKTAVEFSVNMSDAVTTVSDHLKSFTLEKFNIEIPVQVIYNPIDTTLFIPPEDPPETHPLTIVHLSNFRRVKRVEDTLKAFDLIHSQVCARLIMAGEGPERASAQNVAQQLGIADRVEFPGNVDLPEQLLQQAHLLLSTSMHESFGMSIAEAMATGVPVVAYAVGGVPEVVEDGTTGFLVEPGDYSTMAFKALQLLTCPMLHARMGQAARQRVCDHFEGDAIAHQYEQLYEDLLSRPAPAPKCVETALKGLAGAGPFPAQPAE